MSHSTGVLLVNLGTPASPQIKDVRRYLIEFLTDGRVIDFNWLKRQLLVRGVIVPARCKQSAHYYQKIWTSEGSPLLVHSKNVRDSLQNHLGGDFKVELAMRYQEPSIRKGLENLLKTDLDHLIILPLFPQYASATTGSVHACVMKELSFYLHLPKLTFISQYPIYPGYIQACSTIAQSYAVETYDHILFSFHGLPERHLIKMDAQQKCLKTKTCCQEYQKQNAFCYSAQCYATANAIATQLGLEKGRYTVCFQSRLGKEPWMQPYTSAAIAELAAAGKKKLLVLSPSFVADCLETLYEIGMEYEEEFKKAGGEKLDLVRSLNDHPLWVEALRQIVLEQC